MLVGALPAAQLRAYPLAIAVLVAFIGSQHHDIANLPDPEACFAHDPD